MRRTPKGIDMRRRARCFSQTHPTVHRETDCPPLLPLLRFWCLQEEAPSLIGCNPFTEGCIEDSQNEVCEIMPPGASKAAGEGPLPQSQVGGNVQCQPERKGPRMCNPTSGLNALFHVPKGQKCEICKLTRTTLAMRKKMPAKLPESLRSPI